MHRAILVALGIDWEGRRQVLAVEYAPRESHNCWKEFLLGYVSSFFSFSLEWYR